MAGIANKADGSFIPIEFPSENKEMDLFIFREEIGLKIKKSTQNRDKNVINNN